MMSDRLIFKEEQSNADWPGRFLFSAPNSESESSVRRCKIGVAVCGRNGSLVII
jgi:hypothetical protein